MGPEKAAFVEVRCPETVQVGSQARGLDLPCSEQGLADVSNRAPKNASKSFGAGPFTNLHGTSHLRKPGTVLLLVPTQGAVLNQPARPNQEACTTPSKMN